MLRTLVTCGGRKPRFRNNTFRASSFLGMDPLHSRSCYERSLTAHPAHASTPYDGQKTARVIYLNPGKYDASADVRSCSILFCEPYGRIMIYWPCSRKGSASTFVGVSCKTPENRDRGVDFDCEAMRFKANRRLWGLLCKTEAPTSTVPSLGLQGQAE